MELKRGKFLVINRSAVVNGGAGQAIILPAKEDYMLKAGGSTEVTHFTRHEVVREGEGLLMCKDAESGPTWEDARIDFARLQYIDGYRDDDPGGLEAIGEVAAMGDGASDDDEQGSESDAPGPEGTEDDTNVVEPEPEVEKAEGGEESDDGSPDEESPEAEPTEETVETESEELPEDETESEPIEEDSAPDTEEPDESEGDEETDDED